MQHGQDHLIVYNTRTLIVVIAMNGDSGKSRQKNGKHMAHFCENHKNHGKITAVHIAANLLKFMVSKSRKIYILGEIHTTMTSRSACNKAHRLL